MQTFTVSDKQTIEITEPGEYQIQLTESGAEADVFGVFQTANKEQQAVTVVVRHQAPHTRATTTLKGVADDESSLLFTGRIIIDEQCGDSHSFLTERILLLSDQARAETVPDLEIMADDVSCSHAASISNVSEEHIFYLQSRGIDRKRATEMIVEGFLALPA